MREMCRAWKIRNLFFLFVCNSVWAVSFHQNLYTEHAVVNREERLTSSIRVRGEAEVARGIAPYLQLGSELSTLSQQIGNIDTFSYAYGAPGLKLAYGSFALYNEVRFRSYYKESRFGNQTKVDGRALLVYGDFFSYPIAPSSFLFRFAEPYSETLFTTADKNNIIESAYVRLGLRAVWEPKLYTDLFLEPYVTLDTGRHFYNNRADLKLSARVGYQINPISISFITSALYNTYFGRGDAEANPYRDKNLGARFLLVVGGDF